MTSFFGPRPGQIPANMHLGPAARMSVGQLRQWHRQQVADIDNGSVSGSVTITWRARQRQVITLAGDVTLAFDWASAPPGTYLLTIKQDGTGGRSVTWGTGTPGSVWWTAGPDVQAAAGGASLAVIEWDGAQAVGECLRCGAP